MAGAWAAPGLLHPASSGKASNQGAVFLEGMGNVLCMGGMIQFQPVVEIAGFGLDGGDMGLGCGQLAAGFGLLLGDGGLPRQAVDVHAKEKGGCHSNRLQQNPPIGNDENHAPPSIAWTYLPRRTINTLWT